VIALSKKSTIPEECYHSLCDEKKDQGSSVFLGTIQITTFFNGIVVANMYCQHGIRPKNGIPALDYDALRKCLTSLYGYAERSGCTVHAPRIGAVRSGGSWSEIEKIILERIKVETYIYTLPAEKNQWPDTKYENDSMTSSPAVDVDLNSVFK
jgi:O-acetyl-ADP-ribose deacetylase (regulator of RNase III)